MDSFIPFKTAALVLSGDISEEFQVWSNIHTDANPQQKIITTGAFSCNKTFTRRRGQECGNGLFLPVKPPVLVPGDFTLDLASRCCPWGGSATVQPFDDGVLAEISVVHTVYGAAPYPGGPVPPPVTSTAFSSAPGSASFGFISFFVGNPSGGILPVTAALAGCNGGLDWDYRGMIVDLRPPKNYSLSASMGGGGYATGSGVVGLASCQAVLAPGYEFPDFPNNGGSLTIDGPCVFRTYNSGYGPYGSLGSGSEAAGCSPDGGSGAGSMDFTTDNGEYRVIISGSGTWSLTLS